MRRNAGDYVKSWGAALIRGAASNPEFTVVLYVFFLDGNMWQRLLLFSNTLLCVILVRS